MTRQSFALRCIAGLPVTLGSVALLSGCPGTPPPTATTTPAASAASGPFRFADVYPESGVDFRLGHGGRSPLSILDTIGHAAGLLDVDGDGRLDLLLTGPDQVRLYRNLGKWRFQDVTAASGLRQKGYWQGCAAGDLDGDGRTDLYLAAKGTAALYRNLGGGKFQDVTPSSGTAVTDPNRWNSAVDFLDYDGDGRLDLYVAAYVDLGDHSGLCLTQGITTGCGPLHYRPQKGMLYRNLGDWRFQPVTGEPKGHGKTLGALAADWDGDGRPELYLANDQMEADMLRFDPAGKAHEEALARGTAAGPDGAVQGGMGVAATDYNGDGHLDLFVTTFHQEPNSLYRNEGGGTFLNAAFPSGIAAATTRFVGFGAQFADLDNDGWSDLAIANGHPQQLVETVDATTSYAQPAQLLRNTGDGRFQDVSASAGAALQRRVVGRALCTGDLDNDGDIDVVLSDLEGPPMLLRNETPSTHGWLRVVLKGRTGNRDGRGALLTCDTGNGKQVRLATSGGSYYAAGDPRVHFGLGAAREVRRLTVRWPGGKEQTLQDLPVNQEITVTQE